MLFLAVMLLGWEWLILGIWGWGKGEWGNGGLERGGGKAGGGIVGGW